MGVGDLESEREERIRLAKERITQEKIEREYKEKARKSEKLNKKVGRYLKPAGIIATIFFSCYVLLHAILTIASWVNNVTYNNLDKFMVTVLNFLFQNSISPVAIGIMAYVLSLTYVICCLVFSANIIKDADKSVADMALSRTPLIVYVCFFALWSIVPISVLFTSTLPIFVLTVLVIVFIITFVILDIVKLDKEVKLLNNELANEPATGIAPEKQVIEVKDEKKPENSKSYSADDLRVELEKLNKLKEDGLIGEEEYTKLKSSALQKM